MAKFVASSGGLFIEDVDGVLQKVIAGWESFTGWYWFATSVVQTQDSVMEDGSVAMGDTIYNGLVQGFEEEWGDFSLAELNRQVRSGRVWKLSEKALRYSGRRDRE